MVVQKYHDLFICADCGARSGFVGAWLQGTLTVPCFDVGEYFGCQFHKEHDDYGNHKVLEATGRKIRIRPDLNMIGIHMYLSLVKDTYAGKTGVFNAPEDSLETFTQTYIKAIGWLQHDKQINTLYYDKVINFSDTYNTSQMISLYYWANGVMPTENQIQIMIETNQLNLPVLHDTHSCRIAEVVLQREISQNLKEENRIWSIVDEYQNPDISSLLQRVSSKIKPENYL